MLIINCPTRPAALKKTTCSRVARTIADFQITQANRPTQSDIPRDIYLGCVAPLGSHPVPDVKTLLNGATEWQKLGEEEATKAVTCVTRGVVVSTCT
jgi:hypothetical protein